MNNQSFFEHKNLSNFNRAYRPSVPSVPTERTERTDRAYRPSVPSVPTERTERAYRASAPSVRIERTEHTDATFTCSAISYYINKSEWCLEIQWLDQYLDSLRNNIRKRDLVPLASLLLIQNAKEPFHILGIWKTTSDHQRYYSLSQDCFESLTSVENVEFTTQSVVGTDNE